MLSLEKFMANSQEYFKQAPDIAGVAIVEDFRDNITKRQGMLVNGSLRAFAPRTYEVRRNRGKKMLQDTGTLVNSIRLVSATPSRIRVAITNPRVRTYAELHNKGGAITVTPNMKKYAWSQYYKNMGGVKMSVKTHTHSSQASAGKSGDALFWKHMALKRVGSKIKIKQRQFMAKTPDVLLVAKRALVAHAKTMLFH